MPTKLGQNFLKDKSILDKIMNSANLNVESLVIEIGPGEGVLTKELTKAAKKVIAIEIDTSLAEKLKTNLKKTENLTIINADILEINLPELIKKNNFKNYKIVANIPYYITSKIIRLLLETTYPPKEILLMVQKEVAERICAKVGKLSILALSVKFYATPELLFTVPGVAFSPIPEVDSAIIRIIPNKEHGGKEVAKKFFRFIKAGFSAKRKILINNLSSSLHLEKTDLEKKLNQIGITKNQRAQELDLKDWERLIEIV